MAYPGKRTLPKGHRENRGEDTTLMTALRVAPDTHERMVKICEREGVTIGFLTRSLIEYALDRYE